MSKSFETRFKDINEMLLFFQEMLEALNACSVVEFVRWAFKWSKQLADEFDAFCENYSTFGEDYVLVCMGYLAFSSDVYLALSNEANRFYKVINKSKYWEILNEKAQKEQKAIG